MDAKANGLLPAASAVLRSSPRRGILRCTAFFNGVAPTAMGYFLQGAAKFGGYEVFKQKAFSLVRESGGELAVRKWFLPVMLTSAATAELCATALLTPLEVLKLRVQVSPPRPISIARESGTLRQRHTCTHEPLSHTDGSQHGATRAHTDALAHITQRGPRHSLRWIYSYCDAAAPLHDDEARGL